MNWIKFDKDKPETWPKPGSQVIVRLYNDVMGFATFHKSGAFLDSTDVAYRLCEIEQWFPRPTDPNEQPDTVAVPNAALVRWMERATDAKAYSLASEIATMAGKAKQ